MFWGSSFFVVDVDLLGLRFGCGKISEWMGVEVEIIMA